MRLYLRKNGHVTSITVSDQLCHLLAVKLATRAVQYVWDHEFKGRKLVQGWINDLVQHTPAPDSNVSQWVQAQIVVEIADPLIIEKRERLQREHADKQEKFAALRDSAKNQLPTTAK